MKRRTHPTQAEALRLFEYNADTGLLTRKIDWYRGRAGDIAGCVTPTPDGLRQYLRVGIAGKQWGAHQIIWLMLFGYIPEELDHEDRNGINNKLLNLRECTRSQNSANKIAYSTNTSGMKGVSFCKMTGRWRASITRNRVCKNLGRYDTKEEAAAAYDQGARMSFEEFARSA